MVVDVKPAARLADDRVRAQFAWTDRVCAGRGWRFEAWPGAEPVLLENVRYLAGYRRAMAIDATLIPVVVEAASRQRAIGAIERDLAARHAQVLVRPVILHLLWRGLLSADLSQPLGAPLALRCGGGRRDGR
jgi:hypothetical protein